MEFYLDLIHAIEFVISPVPYITALKVFMKSFKGVCLWDSLFMPPPLGAGGIMFSGCPSVRPSVRPSKAWNTLFWPVHRSVGPPDQPLPFYGMSVRPSLQYHFKSLHIISRHYKKSLLRSQIYHGYEELSTDTNYPIWRRQKLPYMKKTRKKKQVCGAACFMAAEIKFSEDVRPSGEVSGDLPANAWRD